MNKQWYFGTPCHKITPPQTMWGDNYMVFFPTLLPCYLAPCLRARCNH